MKSPKADEDSLHGAESARQSPEGPRQAASEILGTAGVAIGGDVFDGRIVRHLVSPALGMGSEYRGLNRTLAPVPSWVYGSLERWHHLSFLNTQETRHMLGQILSQAVEKEKIQALIHVIESNGGYGLYRSVEQVKHALSDLEASAFAFEEPPVLLHEPVARGAFEQWIRADTDAIETCVLGLLEECGVRPEQVDHVFMTGGSSSVPAIRRLFGKTFGPERLHGGSELTSIAEGLALRARSLFG